MSQVFALNRQKTPKRDAHHTYEYTHIHTHLGTHTRTNTHRQTLTHTRTHTHTHTHDHCTCMVLCAGALCARVGIHSHISDISDIACLVWFFGVDTLQHTATNGNTLNSHQFPHALLMRQNTETRCNTLQYAATQWTAIGFRMLCWLHCNVRLHCNVPTAPILQYSAIHCNALQRTATHCNALQRTATHYNALQRITYSTH